MASPDVTFNMLPLLPEHRPSFGGMPDPRRNVFTTHSNQQTCCRLMRVGHYLLRLTCAQRFAPSTHAPSPGQAQLMDILVARPILLCAVAIGEWTPRFI